MVGKPSPGSSGGEGGETFALLTVQKKGIILGLADLEWMCLRDWRAGGVTLKDP